MEKRDFYYSKTAEYRIRRLNEVNNDIHLECKFKGEIFIEDIKHGKTPLMSDKDLFLVGTGTHKDCTYA